MVFQNTLIETTMEKEFMDSKSHFEILEKTRGITPAHIEFFRYLVAGAEICFEVTIEELLKEGKYGETLVYDVRKMMIVIFDERFHLKDGLTGLFFNKDRSTIIHSIKQHQIFMDSTNEVEYKEKFERFKIFVNHDFSSVLEKEMFSKEEVFEILRFNGVKHPLFPVKLEKSPAKM